MGRFNIIASLESIIKNSNDLSDSEKSGLLKNFFKLKEQKLNIMITGATGCGKSSTINALFDTNVAKVGVGVDPETMDIKKFELDNLYLWDTPGLGDGKEADKRHSKNIIQKLNEVNDKNENIIDLVLVILDGSTRDLGTSYKLINEVIIPNLGDDAKDRILIAINQADMAMKGQGWDYENNRPTPPLEKFLDEKADSVTRRVKEATGIDVTTVYYSAGYTEEDGEQVKPYNLNKLLYYILKHTPEKKRIVCVQNVNQTEDNWRHDDGRSNYKKGIFETIADAVGSVVSGIGRAISSVWNTVTGGCYITTATCQEFNKPDDCYELQMFRGFRDNYLAQQPGGKELILEYYQTAPKIVDKINEQSDRTQIYASIRDQYLNNCLRMIEQKQNEQCKELYIQMVNTLKDKYL